MAVRKLLTDGVYVDVGCGGGEARAERRRQRVRPGVAGWGEQERVAGLRRRESEREKAPNG